MTTVSFVGLGSEVTTTSARAAASAGLGATVPPRARCAVTRAGSMSQPATSQPAASRRALSAEPIVPRPTKPTAVMGASLIRAG